MRNKILIIILPFVFLGITLLSGCSFEYHGFTLTAYSNEQRRQQSNLDLQKQEKSTEYPVSEDSKGSEQ